MHSYFSQHPIFCKNVCTHNLKNITLSLNKNELIVFTGVSGSGKSSLAFDTLYVEGQRRYFESLSTYVKRRLSSFEKPDADIMTGLTPTIAIEQKTSSKNPRSTVGTMTEVHDFMRVLFAKIGIKYCPVSKEKIQSQTPNEIIESILEKYFNKKVLLVANYVQDKKGSFVEDLEDLRKKGFARLLINQEIIPLKENIQLDKNKHHTIDVVFDRLQITPEDKKRLSESVLSALEFSKGLIAIFDPHNREKELFSTVAYSPKSGLSYPELYPQDFSFNHPKGMCPECEGLGISLEYDLSLCIDPNLSIAEDCFSLAGSYQTIYWSNIYDNLARLYGFKVTTPFKNLSKNVQDIFLYGTQDKWLKMQFRHPQKNTSWIEYVKYPGVINEAKRRYMEATSDKYRSHMESFMKRGICSSCHGAKIKPYPAHVQIGKKTLQELSELDITSLLYFFDHLMLTNKEIFIAKGLIQEIKRRLHFLNQVGLHYLSLLRDAPSLSGGESQRVRLASQIGSSLVGATYILDEPSIGLHPRDNHKLIDSLKKLRDQGNTVIVVEHDEEMILAADRIVDIGPGAGVLGGKLLVNGNLKDLLSSKTSITGAYLSGQKSVHMPKKRRKTSSFLKLNGACHHNLKNLNIAFPLETFFAVTGVSGSGKSSLISQTLYPALQRALHKGTLEVGPYQSIENLEAIDKVIAIDQSPIGRTARSNPATYIKLFDDIRSLFADLPESKAFGFKAGRFSFNVKEGSCPHCFGMGIIKVDMDFMEDQTIVCPACKGNKFDSKTLSILYKGKSIIDILNMSVEEALCFFEDIPPIFSKLSLLSEVGLHYMQLGQPSTTLSGGEAQRIKLAKELSRPETGKTFYILDEPTTGLHFDDIDKLLKILDRLVNHGNTVCVIEHNIELIASCDYVIDLGPEGGNQGGQLLFNGPFNAFIKSDNETAKYVKKALDMDRSQLVDHRPSAPLYPPIDSLVISHAETNNLKGISTQIPHGKITVCTGPSGSGKSSFAFDTIYAEGQRRYIESLSSFAKQLIPMMPRPKVENIEGLAVSIALEQSKHTSNPRSTLGTMTEIYDYLRILYAKEGIPYCPETQERIQAITVEYIAGRLMQLKAGTKIQILAPIDLSNTRSFEEELHRLKKLGFLRIRLNHVMYHLEESIPFRKQFKNTMEIVIDRLIIKPGIENRLIETLETAAHYGNKKVIAALHDQDLLFNLAFAVESTGRSYPDIIPNTFSFNAEEGMCIHCQGIGMLWGANLEEDSTLMDMSTFDLLVILWKEQGLKLPFQIAASLLDTFDIDVDDPLINLSRTKREVVLKGSPKTLFINRCHYQWIGIEKALEKAAKTAKGDIKSTLVQVLHSRVCQYCQGSRLNPLASNVKLNDLPIHHLTHLPISQAIEFIRSLPLAHPKAMQDVIDQILSRLDFLLRIGLDYLSLDRTAPTLSGGELQRIKLTRQLGSSLSGCLYVIDEPTIGLHPYNNHLLNHTLKHLRDLGNTLLLVEHDPLTLNIADRILDFGPAAGRFGGELIAEGSLQDICNHPHSLTGHYLSGQKKVFHLSHPLTKRGYITIKKAHVHNLKNISVKIPIGALTCITGVSGSGKSTLMHHVIKPLIEKAIRQKNAEKCLSTPFATLDGADVFSKLLVVDQTPVGQTMRSDVSTYVDLLTPLRRFFTSLPEAKMRGLLPMHFSFNHLKGMCRKCWGLGIKTIDLKYLPAIKMTCPDCHGNRLNPLSLKVTYKNKNLGEILKLSIEEAYAFLPPIEKLQKALETLMDIGLGYLTLGQEVQTLSGGEAQRIKLARELTKSIHSKTLILIDEPTTGLHFEDVSKLLMVFEKILEKKATILISEHNADLIRNAHTIIDLGPYAGEKGGELLFNGPYGEFLKIDNSLTNKYL